MLQYMQYNTMLRDKQIDSTMINVDVLKCKQTDWRKKKYLNLILKEKVIKKGWSFDYYTQI